VPDLYQRTIGVVLGCALIALAFLQGVGVFFVFVPIFFIAYLRFRFPETARWFLGSYVVAWAFGHYVLHYSQNHWIMTEMVAMVFLFWVPSVIQYWNGKSKGKFDVLFSERNEEFGRSELSLQDLKKKNASIEKQLREIGHLYDVIKDLGSTLNVQEMIELIKQFTERTFDLPHFIIAILSADGKKYEVKIASGCDESFLRSMEVDVDSNHLIPGLAREKKPIWVASVAKDQRFEKLRKLSIGSFLFIPYVVQDRVIGFMCSYSGQENFIDQEKFSNFQVFFNQIAIGLQKSLLYEKVEQLSITDGLTKLYSHRHFKLRLEEELVLAGRYSSPLSLLILDIDHFKHYNDHYGHVAGDHVLMEVAKILKQEAETTHVVARYGGEEMVLVAPETTKEEAVELAERIRSSVGSHAFAVGQETTKVTVSIGVSTFPYDAHSTLDMISKADEALYAAKNRGRDRVVAYPV
jgi:diguanylate cyclase (GGDEF)-like protein